ncbi:MAG: hypothetical protein ACRC4M_03495 [Mycoplasma sp.]
MNRLKIHDIETYRLLASSPFKMEGAFASVIDFLINLDEQKSINDSSIIIYINAKDKWIQFMNPNIGINSNERIGNLWTLDMNYLNDFKPGAFYIGKNVTIESKGGNLAFRSKLDLEIDKNDAVYDVVSADSILRSFKEASRITITNLYKNHELSEYELVANRLRDIYKYHINNGLKIYINYIDEKVHNFQDNKFVEISSMKDTKYISSTKLDLIENITDMVQLSDKELFLAAQVYKNNANKSMINLLHKKRKININCCLNPNWFNKSFEDIFVDIHLDAINLNFYKTEFEFSKDDLTLIYNWLFEKIKHFAKEEEKAKVKTVVLQPEIKEEELDKEVELETIKLYLTKALNNSTNRFDDFEIIKDKLRFTYHADDGKEITINLLKTKERDFQNDWLNLIPINEEVIEQKYEYDLKVNLKHPFFKEFYDDKTISNKIDHFIICFAIAETICRLDGSSITQLKYEINKLLRGNEDDN